VSRHSEEWSAGIKELINEATVEMLRLAYVTNDKKCKWLACLIRSRFEK